MIRFEFIISSWSTIKDPLAIPSRSIDPRVALISPNSFFLSSTARYISPPHRSRSRTNPMIFFFFSSIFVVRVSPSRFLLLLLLLLPPPPALLFFRSNAKRNKLLGCWETIDYQHRRNLVWIGSAIAELVVVALRRRTLIAR